MENKSTTINTIDHLRLLGQSIGQPALIRWHGTDIKCDVCSVSWNGTVYIQKENDEQLGVENEEVILLKKPLGEISDEEAVELTKIADWKTKTAENGKKIIAGINGPVNGDIHANGKEWWQILDFLRERGYALPWKNWSVEQLVEFRIYKLIN